MAKMLLRSNTLGDLTSGDVGRIDIIENEAANFLEDIDLGDELEPPDDDDVDAARQLTVTFSAAPETPKPLRGFILSWAVTGPSAALRRVDHYDIFGSTAVLRNVAETGSALTSLEKTRTITIRAVFGEGQDATSLPIGSHEIQTDDSECVEETELLSLVAALIKVEVPSKFDELIAEAEIDATVTLLDGFDATHSSGGIHLMGDVRAENSDGSVTVNLETNFAFQVLGGRIVPALLRRKVELTDVDVDGIFNNIGAFFGCGDSDSDKILSRFHAFLKVAVNRIVREVHDKFEERVEDNNSIENPKAVFAEVRRRIGTNDYELAVRYCPVKSLVNIGILDNISMDLVSIEAILEN